MILESGITGCAKLESQVSYCFPSNHSRGHNSRGLKINLGFFIPHRVELTREKKKKEPKPGKKNKQTENRHSAAGKEGP